MKPWLFACVLLFAACVGTDVSSKTTTCSISNASVFIGALNSRPWSAWNPDALKRQIRGLRTLSERRWPMILSVSWGDERDACTCCATLVLGPDGSHLNMVTVFHEADSLPSAFDTAQEFARAAGNDSLVRRLRQQETAGPFAIDLAEDIENGRRTTAFSLFQKSGRWYWQYQEDRVQVRL